MMILGGMIGPITEEADVTATANAVAGRFGLWPRTVRRDVADLWRQGVLIETLFSFADVAPAALRVSA